MDDDALGLSVAQGYSPAHGARFLKRAVDERIELPISAHWHEASHFRVRMEGGAVVVEPGSERSAAAGQAVA